MPEWLMSPEHVARMGGALWVFLWLWGESDPAGGPYRREVRSGAPIRIDEVCASLGLPERTIKSHMTRLRKAGYLTTSREHHAFTAVVKICGLEEASDESRAGICPSPGRPSQGQIIAPDPRSRAGNCPSPAKSGAGFCPSLDQKSAPPAPPGKEEDLFLDIPTYEGSSLNSRGFLLSTNNNKTASGMPKRSGRGKPAFSSKPAYGDVPRSASEPCRREQAIRAHLDRIGEWERPKLTRTLTETLYALEGYELDQVFERAWAFHRTRHKGLDNPPGWWASLLCQLGEECLKSNRDRVQRE